MTMAVRPDSLIDVIDHIADNTLYYQQDLRVPMTSLTIVFHGAGFQQEPVRHPSAGSGKSTELMGLARITAKTLFRGTPTMTREMIAKELELLGASVETHVSETDFFISIWCFSRNLEKVLNLVATVIAQANFSEAELATVKRQEFNNMEAALQEPDRVLAASHEYVVYGMNSYGKFGSRAAIDRITRNEVKTFFSNVRAARVVFFTVISDLSRSDIERQLQFFSSNRIRDGFQLKPEREFLNAQGYEAIIVDSPRATNDRLRWSQRGIAATDDRRFDLNLIIDALGGFEGFIFDQLRNQRGWCYGAYVSVIPATTRPGRIAYYADPAAENSDKLIPEMLRLINVFSGEKDFQQRLSERNGTFKNRYAYQLDIKKKLWNDVNRDRYGVPILDREEYNKRIDAITLNTAQQVIKEVFDPKNMTMVFYGDAERMQKILGKVDPKMKMTVLEKEVLVR